ncbi:MAG: hypothetical protein ACFFDN_20525 [Candidatus Hodarchaeota archaeon]
MVLNWTPEAIVDFIVGTILLVASILTYLEPKIKKLKSILLIRIGIFFMAIFYYFDGLKILLLSIIISSFNSIFLVFAILFLLMGINYIKRESINSFLLILTSCIGILTIYLAFQPELIQLGIEFGHLNVSWIGILAFMDVIYSFMGMFFLLNWGIRTWLNAPNLIRKDALMFLIGIIMVGPIYLINYSLYYVGIPIIIYGDILFAIGTLIFSISILREPKLLYFLPFKINRILVKDRDGSPLFEYSWSELVVDENIFTGFLNAVQLMSEEVMNIGGLLDINLEQGILIVNESKLVTVGLVASKSSKLLRDSLVKFTQEFEIKFQRELKSSVKRISQYEGAYELIEKYFSNFPYRIIKSKKEPLMLTGKYLKIPLELENKLRKVFTDEEEFESIKAELLKAPLAFTSEFIKLHDELKDEIKQISDEEIKLLNESYEENE